MTRQKNTPAAATAQGKTTITEKYTPTLESLRVKILDGITALEIAAEAYEVLSDALGELQVGKDELLSIKKAGAAHD